MSHHRTIPSRSHLLFPCLCLFFNILVCVNPSKTFETKVQLASALDVPTITKQLTEALKTASGLQDLDAVTKALKSLNPDTVFASSLCEKVASKPKTIIEAFYTARLVTTLNCDLDVDISSQVLANSATTTNKISLVYQAVSILKRKKDLGESRNGIVQNLLTLVETKTDESLMAKSLATLAMIELGGAKLGQKFEKFMNLVKLQESFLQNSAEYDSSRIVPGNSDLWLASTATRSVVSLSKASKDALLSNNQVVKLANFFLMVTPKNTIELAHVVQALHALNADMTSLGKPVSVTQSFNYPNLKVSMTNVFGLSVDSGRFSIEIGDRTINLPSSGELDLSAESLPSGNQKYKVIVSGADAYAGALPPPEFLMKIPNNNKLAIKDAYYKVMRNKNYIVADTVNPGEKLRVAYRLADQRTDQTGFEPHQAFVRFSKGDRESFAVTKLGNEEFWMTVLLDGGKDQEIFYGVPGKWKIEIFIGDKNLDEPIHHVVGFVNINIAPGAERPWSMNAMSNNFSPGKIINHIFREQEARPPSSISMLFTALTLSPFLLLLVLWVCFGVNFKMASVTDLTAMVFHVSFGGIFLLYVCFWLELNMFETVRYLFFLGITAAFSGNRLLSKIANKRLHTDSSKKKTN